MTPKNVLCVGLFFRKARQLLLARGVELGNRGSWQDAAPLLDHSPAHSRCQPRLLKRPGRFALSVALVPSRRRFCSDDRACRRHPGLELKAHPHMLRHACGHALANKGHDTRAIQGWLGHRSITGTAGCRRLWEAMSNLPSTGTLHRSVHGGARLQPQMSGRRGGGIRAPGI
jgi:Phage integrase family